MKTQSVKFACLLAGVTAFNLALMPTSPAQMTTPTPSNPSGAESDSKSTDTSAAQERDASTGNATTPATAPATKDSKDENTTALDKNPSTASSDSAPTSTTKTPSDATTENQGMNGSTNAASEHFSDRHFLVKAAEGGMTEVQLGQIAQEKASSDAVKQFGARMVTDHSKANDDLKAVAQQKGVSVPSKLDAHHQAMVDSLSKLSGPAFDRAYVNDMVSDHQKDVAEFQRASTSAQDPDVKAFASRTLPVLQSHLSDIQNLQSNLK